MMFSVHWVTLTAHISCKSLRTKFSFMLLGELFARVQFAQFSFVFFGELSAGHFFTNIGFFFLGVTSATHLGFCFFRMPEKLYSAYGFVVTFWVYAVEKLYPSLLAFADKIRRNALFDNPPVKISFPADVLDFTVDKLLAATVLTNAFIYAFLTCDADVMHVGLSAPDNVNGKKRRRLTFSFVFVMIHT